MLSGSSIPPTSTENTFALNRAAATNVKIDFILLSLFVVIMSSYRRALYEQEALIKAIEP
jgi:hypothetical protein